MFRTTLLLISTVLLTTNMNAVVKVDKIEYKGWKNCYRVTNGEIELIVTGDVGPRVIRFGFVGGQNLFKEFPDELSLDCRAAGPVVVRADYCWRG